MTMTNFISFPKLGIDMNLSPIAFSIGEKSVYWYALIILFGFLMGILIVTLDCEKRGLKKDNTLDIAIYGLVAGILGARIYYVLFSLDEFRDDWLSVFYIWEGGLAIYGGIIGAGISTFIYCKIKKLNVLNVFDICCVGLLLGQAIGRWGNFFNCEVYGRPTEFFLGMSINSGAPVHPLFLYESLWNLVFIITSLLLFKRRKFDGQVFASYLMYYGIGRFMIESLRTDSLYFGPFRVSQLVAVGCFFAGALITFYYMRVKKQITEKAGVINEE